MFIIPFFIAALLATQPCFARNTFAPMVGIDLDVLSTSQTQLATYAGPGLAGRLGINYEVGKLLTWDILAVEGRMKTALFPTGFYSTSNPWLMALDSSMFTRTWIQFTGLDLFWGMDTLAFPVEVGWHQVIGTEKPGSSSLSPYSNFSTNPFIALKFGIFLGTVTAKGHRAGAEINYYYVPSSTGFGSGLLALGIRADLMLD